MKRLRIFREKIIAFYKWIKSHINTTLVITLIATILGGLIVIRIIETITYYQFYSRPYITFEADFTQVFHLSEEIPSLEYSVGEKSWKKLSTQSIVFGGNRGKLLLRGLSTVGTDEANISFATNAQVICTGDIRTLVNYKQYKNAYTGDALFSHLFENCTQLVVAPELPCKNLAENCYLGMFAGCTSLKTAPSLPAETLTKTCYFGMFYGCTSLEVAPTLPAKKLAESCYKYMFYGCTSLKTAPILPSKDLAVWCYLSMFSGCTSLKTAPYKLPAETLTIGCYELMFEGCISLEKAPTLPAKNLVESCYDGMFSGCTSLSEITMLAININAENCINGWLNDIDPEGTFYKNKNAQWEDIGVVPKGWTVELTSP